jgi:hypothetical protein
VIESTIGALIDGGMRVDGPVAFAKGSVWELHANGGALVAGRYLAPPT